MSGYSLADWLDPLPERVGYHGQGADTRTWYEKPFTTQVYLNGAAAIITLAVVVFLMLVVSRRGFRRTGVVIMHTLRRRAALAICLGLAILALDWLVVGQLSRGQYFWEDLHRDHWISLAGIALALVGAFHWIAGAEQRP